MFNNVEFMMVRPSHPGNVGACARAIKTMGFHRLSCVSPRFEDVKTHPDAIAFASGADDVLAATTIFPDLSQALQGATVVVALSARARDLSHPVMPLREGVAWALDTALTVVVPDTRRVVFMLGSERTGLEQAELLCSQRQIMIPANPRYASLNVAQAAQVLAYELRMACLEREAEQSATSLAERVGDLVAGMTADASLASPPPTLTHEQLQHLQAAWLEAMAATGFLNPAEPKRMVARVARLLARSSLEQSEYDWMMGFFRSIKGK